MKWKVWYKDGEIFEGTSQAEWLSLPSSGVMAVVVYKETGRTIYDGADWYYYHQDVIGHVPSKSWSGFEPKPALPCASCVKQGVAVPDEVYETMSQQWR